MGWNARKFAPWMMMIFFIAGTVCVRFTTAQGSPFVVGIDKNPPKLDPQDQYDSESQKVIGQVCEGLYRYNYSSPEMETIPQLANAIGYFEGNNLIGYNYTVSLREEVTFHDGTPFNASAVKWTFDRIQYFSYGLYENDILVAKSAVLMESYSIFAVSGVPILNHTMIESEFVIRFVLNTAPGFFERLLAFMATQIMLPDEGYTRGEKFSGFIRLNDNLIGTGPFELVEYEYDNMVVFKSYDDYYLDRPENYIKNMNYIICDRSTLTEDFLNYENHWYKFSGDPDDWVEFNEDPNLIKIDTKSPIVYFVQMNMENIPQCVRKASSFAFNYTYLHEVRLQNLSLYLHTPIPDGMSYHYTGFSDEPYTNLTFARELVLAAPDEGIGDFENNVTSSGLTIFNSTAEWIAVADSTNPLAWYNFTSYYSGLDDHYFQLAENMKNIGIRIDMVWISSYLCFVDEYLHDQERHKKLTYSFGWWSPDYNDPINMIEPLYGRNAEGGPASGNYFLLNDPILNGMLNETYFTSNSTIPSREELFHGIQELLVTELVPTFYLYQQIKSISFNRLYVKENTIDDLKNAFGDFYWFNVVFDTPWPGFPIIFYLLPTLAILAAVGVLLAIVHSIMKATEKRIKPGRKKLRNGKDG